MKTSLKFIPTMAVLAIILALASMVTNGPSGPSDWLVDWTNWVATFAGISFGGRALWFGSSILKNRFDALNK